MYSIWWLFQASIFMHKIDLVRYSERNDQNGRKTAAGGNRSRRQTKVARMQSIETFSGMGNVLRLGILSSISLPDLLEN